MTTEINIHNKHEIRNKVVDLFLNIGLSEIESKDLEIGIFNSTIDYCNLYKISLSWSYNLFSDTYINIARSIYSNLKEDSYIKNKNLLLRLKNKEFLPHNLPFMECKEIFPEKWENIIEKHKMKIKEAYEIKQISMSENIRCGKCKNNKISYYELQTRSGDEAMSIFYNCITCGHKWKN